MLKNIKNLFKKQNEIGIEGAEPCGPIELGNWIVDFNHPFGIIVKNTKTLEEYHFYADSDGWITSKHQAKKESKPAILSYSTRSLLTGQFYPTTQLVDKETMKDSRRLLELRSKSDLTIEEKDELLKLSGLRK